MVGGEVAAIPQDVIELGTDKRAVEAEKPNKKDEKAISAG